MSDNEKKRRYIASVVFTQAWRIFKRGAKVVYSFRSCLKVSWRTVKSLITIYHTKVSGVLYNNEDGVNRQQILKILSSYPSDKVCLFLKRDRRNIYDNNAIKIIATIATTAGKYIAHIGYVKKRISKMIALLIDKGLNPLIISKEITGGNNGKYYGCNFSICFI